jgi:hypothetical protein
MKHSHAIQLGWFIGRLIATPIGQRDGRTVWELQFPLTFHSRRYEYTHEIKKGTQTDFGSVPRVPVLWWLFSDIGQQACAFHDDVWDDPAIPRKVANLLFLDALLIDGVKPWVARCMYWAVELKRKLKGTTK